MYDEIENQIYLCKIVTLTIRYLNKEKSGIPQELQKEIKCCTHELKFLLEILLAYNIEHDPIPNEPLNKELIKKINNIRYENNINTLHNTLLELIEQK
ncbi:MAG: hypothetical protein GON13_00640 [Nanoarchaeota archaeon]|nr:hypothetical protein [Nanoarchaeota archaeon]